MTKFSFSSNFGNPWSNPAGAMHGRLGMSSSPPTSPRSSATATSISSATAEISSPPPPEAAAEAGARRRRAWWREWCLCSYRRGVSETRSVVVRAVVVVHISGMLLYMGSLGFDVVNLKQSVVGVVVHNSKYSKRFSTATPGSVYRSPQVFREAMAVYGEGE
uniref:Uncharacterized protein n=1 Tax=Fagus sylvatica TaxID=28930 RepID=A0A2N9HDG7_FAGSY